MAICPDLGKRIGAPDHAAQNVMGHEGLFAFGVGDRGHLVARIIDILLNAGQAVASGALMRTPATNISTKPASST